ncbi:pseudouridine synthase [Sediminibacillus albus]|uniref:Pseudouridine synthase n=1 Tax=Sediminibacillus albus TaxID=407036 RepID=A0A1G9BZ05_9BACI|nr:pseudouridine synthase [Sediminibacillus albus]SDK44706.1 16S rRNA pseudouridine516 synthase [Sediminibacillus albus]
MRIDKLLANMGYGSRKEVKNLLKKGSVSCNGEPIKSPQTQVVPGQDSVTVFGEEVDYKEYIYLMMNKPPGYLSATEDNRDATVIDLLEPEDVIFDPFPVGRLDKDTEGLLLITNDGKLAHQLLSPKKDVGKTYYAVIDGKVVEADKQKFKEGVELDDGYVTRPAHLQILSSGNFSEIEITITEGKFHQVKRMFEAVGKRVSYLKRISMGKLALDPDLGKGEYRELSDEELSYLVQTVQKSYG